MPRPQRAKIAPSAPAQLPESLMRAIRADKAGKELEQQQTSTRRTSARINRKSSPQEYSMSGALGARVAQENVVAYVDTDLEFQDISLSPALDEGERDMVPSSVRSEDMVLPTQSSTLAAPSTVRRPIVSRPTMSGANWHIQATPRIDSSAIGNFKRRPRQPSILGIGRQDDSSELSSLGGGNGDTFLDDLENFEPTVATPLVRAEVVTRAELKSSPPPTMNIRKRKRGLEKDSDIQVRRTPSYIADESSHFVGSSPELPKNKEISARLPANGEITNGTSRTTAKSPSPIWSDIMAPPQSSPSDAASDNALPQLHTSKQKRNSQKETSISNRKSLPRTRSQKSQPLQPISTAQLQNLLPSRKIKSKSKPDDSLDLTLLESDDENEDSFQPTRRRRGTSKQPKTPLKKSAAPKTKAKTALKDKTNTKSQKVTGSVSRKSQHKTAPSTLKPATKARNYTRKNRVASGQENGGVYSLPSTQDQLDDTSNETLGETHLKANTDELEAIAKKFAEVDEWEMEFEEVDNSSGSGSGLLLV